MMEGTPFEPELLALECLLADLEAMVEEKEEYIQELIKILEEARQHARND